MDELLPTARELMTADYLAVRPSLGLMDAIGRLERHHEDTAFVVDDHGHLVGILTEKACLCALAARAYHEEIAERVGDVMSAVPFCLAPTMDAYAITHAFRSSPCGILPVADNGRIIGAVSQLAMLRAFLHVVQHRATVLGTIEQTAADLSQRPEAIERLQRVCARLDRFQLAQLLGRSH